MSNVTAGIKQVFDSFDVADLEILKVSQGASRPKTGASCGTSSAC